MIDEHRGLIAARLSDFPEVTWDRYTHDAEQIEVVGWIDGEEPREFLMLTFRLGVPSRPGLHLHAFITSSDSHRKAFAERLGFSSIEMLRSGRAEHLFGDLVANVERFEPTELRAA